MKIYGWTEMSAPPLSITPSGMMEFYDYETAWGFEVGDWIHYRTKLGLTKFEVVRVEEANEPGFDKTLHKVRAQKRE